ncbi:MAG: hypothetical protein EBY29_16370 [Planctomycetes bacterium]|nr:hypothetical protein [Planctomycetota bacterium]
MRRRTVHRKFAAAKSAQCFRFVALLRGTNHALRGQWIFVLNAERMCFQTIVFRQAARRTAPIRSVAQASASWILPVATLHGTVHVFRMLDCSAPNWPAGIPPLAIAVFLTEHHFVKMPIAASRSAPLIRSAARRCGMCSA